MTVRNRLAAAAIGLSAVTAPLGAHAAEFINVLTGGTSGVYYPMGVALSSVACGTMPRTRSRISRSSRFSMLFEFFSDWMRRSRIS